MTSPTASPFLCALSHTLSASCLTSHPHNIPLESSAGAYNGTPNDGADSGQAAGSQLGA